MTAADTIAALATAFGSAGVGIVRVSGPQARAIGETLAGQALKPRHALHAHLRDAAGEVLDDAVVLYFQAPHSYTGEDVLELQAHGNPALLNAILRECRRLGARDARPGEFTERAFLNDKLDLAQAEAVADLISAQSEAAARAARRSLDGVFSQRCEAVAEQLVHARVYVEAALDFPDEEIDFLAAPEIRNLLDRCHADLARLRAEAEQGKRLMDGLHVVIVGAPNAGKSSLLNALAGSDRAIVTEIAGTTRDVLRETVQVDGLWLTLVDTAGLRETEDRVENEGIRRARGELDKADLILAVLDDSQPGHNALADELRVASGSVLWLHNKADLSGHAIARETRDDGVHLWLSAKHGDGLAALKQELARAAGLGEAGTGAFSARARHLEALDLAAAHLEQAMGLCNQAQAELAAEELRLAHDAVGSITGTMDADALLGRIFGSFCIGK
ncbi:tRNA modification GTPase MnmE [Arenimonas maotaiensis]|uniref:tRNA modification GTPase MnmE n=1 Tax=Arenimonas maotaiensis TaxID=1446479 RepID=A0A917FPD1_9GAMM|nr:tRNA uridine-5-carboxymethylaminomethyl(34) synthesis GTPase MnmE [Arenimonas maotaiensis]GGF94527.1 tRNA modification GTPase MnmE [Arenimonas maotaiensis]